MATITQFLNMARSQLSYREGRGNNNKYGIWYTKAVSDGINWNYQPYCAMALTWVASNVTGGLSIIGGYWHNCASWSAWFRRKKQFHTSGPQRGDIVFFDWSGLRRQGKEMHVGIVEEVRGNYVVCLEFNTTSGSKGNQSDGGGCYRRIRHISLTTGFGRPKYAPETAVAVVTKASSDYKNRTDRIPLVVDGAWGAKTTQRLQQILRTQVTGSMDAATLRALSVWLGLPPRPEWTSSTRTALQHRVGVPADGKIGPITVRALQRYLNRNNS